MADLDNPYDLNRDGQVNLFDLIVARDNGAAGVSALQLITVPDAAPSGAPDVSHDSFVILASPSSFFEVEQFSNVQRIVLASTWSGSIFNQRDGIWGHRVSRRNVFEIKSDSLLDRTDSAIGLLPEVLSR